MTPRRRNSNRRAPQIEGIAAHTYDIVDRVRAIYYESFSVEGLQHNITPAKGLAAPLLSEVKVCKTVKVCSAPRPASIKSRTVISIGSDIANVRIFFMLVDVLYPDSYFQAKANS